jgi:hypothetical protein
LRRYYKDMGIERWDTAIKTENCDKGFMMMFLHWFYQTYVLPYILQKRKKRKKKSVNQYWQDFKMLYRRINGTYVNANDSNEVVKVFFPLPLVSTC